MISPAIDTINGIKIAKYQEHPRILELRLIMIHKALTQAYDYNLATEFYKTICVVFRCNWQLVSGILNNVYKIRALEKLNRKRYQQEIVFMGVLFNESRYYIADAYLSLARETVYRKSYGLNVEEFLDQSWLDELDDTVKICGIQQYKIEALRFLEGLQNFLEVLGRVSIPKTKI